MSNPPDVYLGLDVGDVRIGLAISRSGIISEPLVTITRTDKRQVLDDLQRVVEQNRVTVCVVGLPRLTGGDEGNQAEKTRAFIRSLQRRIPKVRYVFEDERFSSSEARDLIGGGRASKKGELDRVAAAIILLQYLDRLASERPSTTQQPEGA